MTDNEIIKALERCVNLDDCTRCPLMRQEGICRDDLIEQSLSLINRQQAEIERLQDALIDNEYANCVAVKNGLIYTHTLDDYDKLIGDISAEAIKELAERLCDGRVSNDPVVIAVKCELKEMVGDDNG